MVEVTQADREAAVKLLPIRPHAEPILAGEMDDHPFVEAFARHRIDAFNAGLRRGAEIADELGGDRERNLDNIEFRAQHVRAKTIAQAIREQSNGA